VLVVEDYPGEVEWAAPGVEAEAGCGEVMLLVPILRQPALFPMELVLSWDRQMS